MRRRGVLVDCARWACFGRVNESRIISCSLQITSSLTRTTRTRPLRGLCGGSPSRPFSSSNFRRQRQQEPQVPKDPWPVKSTFLSSHRSVFEYVLGVCMGLAAGYLIWAAPLAKSKQKTSKDVVAAASDSAEEEAQPLPIYTIVLTGGPCGGKSSAMQSITKHLQEKGFHVYFLPEVPTLLFNAGVSHLEVMDENQLLMFEQQLMKIQLQFENSMKAIARSLGKPSVILLDRAAMDVSAYLPLRLWHQLLDANHWSEHDFYNRYDGVIHLVTAARGAEEFYTKANNKARTEEPQTARDLDDKVKQAWIAHSHLAVIDNSTDFARKMERTCAELERILQQVEKERKEKALSKTQDKKN